LFVELLDGHLIPRLGLIAEVRVRSGHGDHGADLDQIRGRKNGRIGKGVHEKTSENSQR
jgi:hypothetical protein